MVTATDANIKTTFKIQTSPIYIDDVLTDLRDNDQKFGMVLKNKVATLDHSFYRELELIGIIGISKTFFKCLEN